MLSISRIRWIAVAGCLALLGAAAPAAARQQGQPGMLTLVPTVDTVPAPSCNEMTARLTTADGVPISGATIDVRMVYLDAQLEPEETQEHSFCDPSNPNGPNPTGQGATAFGDVSGNNQASTPGEPGRNTDVHGEVGSTDANGEVTFGVSLSSAGITKEESTVTAWWEPDDDDVLEGGEPADTSTIRWVHSDGASVSFVDAAPESATQPNGTQHQVTVTVMTTAGPAVNVTPTGIVVASSFGRPGGDPADPAAGQSPNSGGQYACTPTSAQGVATCTFQDPAGTPAGTDTVLFFVDADGDGPDEQDPQDAVQVTWMHVEQGPPTPTPTPTATPTPAPTPSSPTPTPAAAGPRNVRLCHGAASVTSCETEPVALFVNDDHLVAALVTDRQGVPVAGVPVELRLSGEGRLEGGARTAQLSTGPDGVARATVSSPTSGSSTIVAEISPPGTPGSVRGWGAADDECEQPAGPTGAPAAGNCVSNALLVHWETGHDPAACDDGVDNDGDGLVDGEDPGCVDEDDDSEFDFGIEVVHHDRTVSMRFRDRDDRLVVFGRIRLADGEDFSDCSADQHVRVQRRVDGDWKTIATANTNPRGRYEAAVFDRPGRHRAVLPRAEVLEEDPPLEHVCRKALIVKRHRHRG